jgi:antitoxin component YwqK of YwqJK toxin-antitoxin module
MNNRHYILTFCLIVLYLAAFAQEAPVYYGKNGKIVSNRDSAIYYRVIDSREGDSFKFTEYHKDGTWIKAFAKGNLNYPDYENVETIYYKTGKVAMVMEYEHYRLRKATSYYPNGVLMQVIDYHNKIWPDVVVVYDADSLGNVHIFNGNGTRKETDSLRLPAAHEHFTMEGPYKNGRKDGVWKGSDDKGITFEEQYEEGKFISGKSRAADGKKYKYERSYVNANFDGDPRDVEKRIRHSLKTPADTLTLRANVHHVLSLSYTIDENGELKDICGYDKTTLKPVKLELTRYPPKVNAARFKGVPVESYITMPYTINSYKQVNNTKPFNTDVYLNGTYTRP